MSIDEVRAWFVAHGGGITAGEQLLYERLAGQLAAGEALEQAMAVNCDGAMGHMVLTDQRLIHIGTNILKGMVVVSIPRADVTGFKIGGLLIHKGTVTHRGGKLKLMGALKPQMRALAEALGY